MPDVRYAGRPFDEQVRFFAGKVNVPTARYDDLWREDHAHGFMVAGAARESLLTDLRRAVERAIADGETLAQFRGRFDELVDRHGWTGWTGEESRAGRAWRTRVIYDTNVRQSYSAGREAQLTHPDMLAVRPYWQYRHNDVGISRTPRLRHQAWHGNVRHHSDPWWRTHTPQNGYGCKCGKRGLSADDVRRLGLTVLPADDSGDTTGVDPGFAYNVGEAARSRAAAVAFGQRVAELPPAWRDVALRDSQRRANDYFADAAPQLARALAGTLTPTRDIAVGVLSPRAVDAAIAAGEGPASALIAVRVDVAQRLAQSDIPPDFVRELVARLAQPAAIYRDTVDGSLVYAWRLDDERIVLLTLGRTRRPSKGTVPPTAIRDGRIVSSIDARYALIEGTL